MLILAIVCVAWLEIIGIQSARKEARRREAVERLSGMMDAFMYIYKARVDVRTGDILQKSGYAMVQDGSELHFVPDESKSVVYPMFEENVSSIGYRLLVVASSDSNLDSHVKEMLKEMKNWGEGNTSWLIGLLYDSNGNVNDVGRPFFTLPIHLGLQL